MARSLDSFDSMCPYVLLICCFLICLLLRSLYTLLLLLLPVSSHTAAPASPSTDTGATTLLLSRLEPAGFLGIACYCFCRCDFCHFCFCRHSTTTLSVIILLPPLLPLPPPLPPPLPLPLMFRLPLILLVRSPVSDTCSVNSCDAAASFTMSPGFIPGWGQRNNAEVGTKSVPTSTIARSFII